MRHILMMVLSMESCCLAFLPTSNFGGIGKPAPPPRSRACQARAPALMMSASSPTATPSWDALVGLLGREADRMPADEPMLTLYRDNNGWCPFCERVWLALLVKGIPFEEKTLSLQNKPKWYLDKVETGLVPAIEFKGSNEVLSESRDILLRLENDDKFTDFKSLLPSDEKERANVLLDECDGMAKSIAGVLYGANATSEELAAKMKAFEESMGKMEALLQESASPFFLSSGFSVVDCMIVPILERLAVQLPLKTGIALRDKARWPAVDAWFVAMETEVAPYRDRVQGDPYSWSASFVTILEMFQATQGIAGNNPLLNAKEQATDILEQQLSASPLSFDKAARVEALQKLVANHAAIVADVTSEAKTQKGMARLAEDDAPQVDRALRRAAALLLQDDDQGISPVVEGISETEAKAARLVASRLCVPRDMGGPAAGALRASLGSVALAAQ